MMLRKTALGGFSAVPRGIGPVGTRKPAPRRAFSLLARAGRLLLLILLVGCAPSQRSSSVGPVMDDASLGHLLSDLLKHRYENDEYSHFDFLTHPITGPEVGAIFSCSPKRQSESGAIFWDEPPYSIPRNDMPGSLISTERFAPFSTKGKSTAGDVSALDVRALMLTLGLSTYWQSEVNFEWTMRVSRRDINMGVFRQVYKMLDDSLSAHLRSPYTFIHLADLVVDTVSITLTFEQSASDGVMAGIGGSIRSGNIGLTVKEEASGSFRLESEGQLVFGVYTPRMTDLPLWGPQSSHADTVPTVYSPGGRKCSSLSERDADNR